MYCRVDTSRLHQLSNRRYHKHNHVTCSCHAVQQAAICCSMAASWMSAAHETSGQQQSLLLTSAGVSSALRRSPSMISLHRQSKYAQAGISRFILLLCMQ
jgi:hypothetical protein